MVAAATTLLCGVAVSSPLPPDTTHRAHTQSTTPIITETQGREQDWGIEEEHSWRSQIEKQRAVTPAFDMTINGARYAEYTGTAVSSGDVNVDGYDDVITWSSEFGVTYVVFGSKYPSTAVDLANLGSAGMTITGSEEVFFWEASSVCAGDFNGDGYDDVLIGSPSDYGVTYVVFGSKFPPSTVNLTTLGSAGVTMNGPNAASFSGYSVSSGDVNGDGYDDVIIGAPGPQSSYSGVTYVVFGSRNPAEVIDLAKLGSVGMTINGFNHGNSGARVSSGDVNGDGKDDVIIGAPYQTGDAALSGVTFVVFGSENPDPVVDLSTLGSVGMTIWGVGTDGYTGSSVSCGDVNGDGYGDVIVGGYNATGDYNNSGVAYVVFGSESPESTVSLSSLEGGIGMSIVGSRPLSQCGRSVCAGDVNGDSIDDVAIGCPNDNGDYDRSGVTYVVFGSPSPPAVVHLDTLGTEGIQINGLHGRDALGWSVNVGDVNGDGKADVISGASDATGDEDASGVTYVVFGSDFLQSTPVVERV